MNKMTFRQKFALVMPYWMWRCFAINMKNHMREVQPIQNLQLMVNAPDESLDKKGKYVKQCAREILNEYRNGDIKKIW